MTDGAVRYGRLDHSGSTWAFEVVPHVALRLKRIFPRMNQGAAKVLTVDDTPDTARDIEWFLTRYELELTDRARTRLADQMGRFHERESITDMLIRGILPMRNFDLALPLRDYQKVGCEAFLRLKALLVADELGVGKTALAIGALTHAEVRPALVVTMTHLTKQWQSQLRRFAPGLTTHVLKQGKPYDIGKPKRTVRGQIALINTTPDVIITNYHKLSGWAETLAPILNGVVYDEAQELRHPGSNKYMGAKFISDNVTYRLGLTGTPIFNEGDEMHAVLECIRPGELGESGEFNREWCEHGRVKDPKAFGFFLREAGLMLRRTRKDVSREIPPVSRCIQKVDCDTAKLDDITNAAGELAKIILAQSEVQGAAFRASGELDGLVRQATGIAKAPYCAEFIRMLVDAGEPVLVYAWHRTVYDILKARLRAFNPVMFTGTESATQKQKAFDKFASGESKVMLMSLRAGQGLDGLQNVCRTVVFAELDWAHGVHLQCEGRVARDQQEHPVVCYYLVADEGSDPIVVDVLGIKRDQLEGIIDPDKDLLAPVDTDVREHIKRLAAAYLEKQKKNDGAPVMLLGEARARKQAEDHRSPS